MDLDDILKKGRSIWGDDKLSLEEIIVRLSVVVGDISRLARDEAEGGKALDAEELKKELGNVIVSVIRWCDDLGYSPEDCVKLAVRAQESYRGQQLRKECK